MLSRGGGDSAKAWERVVEDGEVVVGLVNGDRGKCKPHIGYVPYKTGGKCMVCTYIAAYAFHRVL